MSDKWEVVTKSKKTRAAAVVELVATNGGNNGAKKKNTLKMEDILPREQLNSLYSLNDSVRKSPTATANNKRPAATKPKLPDALVPARKLKDPTASAVPHRPKPRNLELGLAALNIGEIESLLESYRSSYPESHLIWLKAIVAHLNTRLNVETDPAFVGHSPNYPSNIVPAPLKALLVQTLTDAGTANVQYFYDQTLNDLMVDQSKGLPGQGHRILLQLIAVHWPPVCVRSLAKTALLRNSYQSRPPIGSALLWAVGQGGLRDVPTGIRAWQNIMLPVLETKAYSRFVCEYLGRVLSRADDTATMDLSAEELLRTYDELVAPRPGLARELRKLLAESAEALLVKYVQCNNRFTPIFVPLLKRLEGNADSRPEVIVRALVQCLDRDADCYKAWRINVRKFVGESNQVMEELNSRRTVKSQAYSDFLTHVLGILNAIPENKVDNDILVLRRHIKNAQDKSASSKSSSGSAGRSWIGCFVWLFLISCVATAIVGALLYDTHTHGNSFAKSATGQFLERQGVLPYVQAAWLKAACPAARALLWVETNVPPYAAHAYTVLYPYALFARDLALVAWSAIVRGAAVACDCFHQKAPVVVAFVEQYAPGLPQKVGDASVQLWSNVRDTSLQVYASSFEYFKTKVFIGNLAPEQLNRTLIQTIHSLTAANKWFHQQVELYAKQN